MWPHSTKRMKKEKQTMTQMEVKGRMEDCLAYVCAQGPALNTLHQRVSPVPSGLALVTLKY